MIVSAHELTKSDAEPRDAEEARSDRIVRLAAPLFLERGFDAVSINDIIDVTGGSKATIYANFGSKTGLFEAVVKIMCSRVTIGIDISDHGTLTEQLIRIGTSFLKGVLTRESLQFHRMMVSVGRHHPTAGKLFYDSGPRKAMSIIAEWVQSRQAEGLLAPGDPHALAAAFHDMMISELQLSWLTSDRDRITTDDIDARVRLCARIFLGGAA